MFRNDFWAIQLAVENGEIVFSRKYKIVGRNLNVFIFMFLKKLTVNPNLAVFSKKKRL